MASNTQEPGYQGRIISLGGIKGTQDHGRQAFIDVWTSTGTGYLTVPANSRRIALLLQNSLASSHRLRLSLGDLPTVEALALQPGESIQFDQFLPWTGSVVMTSEAGSTTFINIVEISVDGG